MRDLVLATALLAVVAAGCGEDPSPTLPFAAEQGNATPIIHGWEPPSDTLDVFVGDDVQFVIEVSDPDDDPISVRYFLDGAETAAGAAWTLAVETAGEVSVVAAVSDGEATLFRLWHVRGVLPPPPAVRLLQVEPLTTFGTVVVTWIPGADSARRPLGRYEIRASRGPFEAEPDWDAAEHRLSVEAPAGPVPRMAATLGGLGSGTWHVTVRGRDSRGLLSGLARAAEVRIVNRRVAVTVIDAVTRFPLGGMRVDADAVRGETSADGQFVLDGVDGDRFELSVSDGNDDGIGGYYDYHGFHAPGQVVVQLIPDVPVASESYPDFPTMYEHLTTLRGIPDGARTRRWEFPLNVYVPPFSRDGLDYRATILAAIEDLERIFRRDLFNIVDGPPAVGLRIVYDGRIYADRYIFESFTADYFPERARIAFRTHYDGNDAVAFLTVVRHEFGHALGLINHSPDTGHLMVGGTAAVVTHFTPDERRVLATFLSLPRGADPILFIQE